VVSGAAPGAASGGAVSGGAEPGGAGSKCAESGGAEPEGVEPGGAESEGAEPGGAESEGAESRGAEPRVGEPGDTGAGGAAVITGAGDPTEPGAAGAGGAGAGVAGVGGLGAGGAGAAGARAVDPGAGGAGGTVRLRPYFVPLLQQVLSVPSSTGLPPPFLCPPPDQCLTERREPASRLVSPVRTARRAPRSRPPPVPGTHTMALPRAASPTVTRLLATAVTDPSFEPAAASTLVAELLDFAAAYHLDYASALVAESVPISPPSVEGECALGTDALEDRQEDSECLATAAPRFASFLLAPEGDPNAPDIPTLRSYAEAITGPYSSQVKQPPGSPPAFKARYVARGFSQRQGVDYFHTFSPTPKMTTLRVLLHVAAQRDYELHSLDFSTAFLQGSLHEEIWLRRPPGFTGSFPTATQWSLRRPVYGLRQAPREWHDTLRTTLAALGFAPSTADPSLFLRTNTSLPPFYVLVYVDDLVFATAGTEALTLVKSKLQKRHTCTDLGELRSYLGLQITRDRARRTITLTQSHMVHQVLQCFGFQYSSPQHTPLSTSHSLSAPPSDESVEPSGPYPELVGCPMYLMTCTRPDLAYPLSLLARYVAPGRHRKVHWDAAKRVLRYLCSTSGMGLVLGGRGLVVLTGHVDASWVDDSATQRSLQGYTFSLGSGSVSWRSTRSSSVLSFSCEAGIYAGVMAAQELRWLTYLLTDLGEQPRLPPVLYVDNKAMIALCQEHRLEHRTKHIALRYFLARDLQQRSQLRLAYVATRANTADVFTKALPPGDHQRFDTVLGLPRATPPCLARFPSAHALPCPSRRPCLHAALLVARHPALSAMASLSVLTFDHEGCPIQFDTRLDDLHLYLLSDSRDSVSLFDHTSAASLAPPDTADSASRSQWLTRDAAARLSVRNHLPLAKRAHFGQHKTAKAMYNAVVARYSSPATAALGRLILPYLFPELSAFATVKDLITHLRTSDTRYCAALKADFLDKNPPPMDHFLALDPTYFTVDLLDKLLLADETSIVVVGSARGTPCTPFFDGCSPSPLAPSYASAAAVDILGREEVGAASAPSGMHRSGKGKGGKSGGGGSGGGGGGGGGGSGGGGGGGGSGGGSGGFGGGGGGIGGSGGGSGGGSRSGGGGSGGGRGGAVQRGGFGSGQRQQQQRLSKTPTPQHLCIEAAALGASESALLGTAPAEALHIFKLDSGASRWAPILAHSTTVLPCPAVPSSSLSGLHLPLFSTTLVSTAALRDAMVTTTTTGGQCVAICTCTRTGRHLATFSRRPGSSLYTLTTEPAQTLLWYRRLGHPSLPHLRGMHSRLLVSGLPRSLPPLPPLPAPPCLPCVEGRQRAAPSLLLDSPDDRSPEDSPHGRVRDRFREDLLVLRLHSDRGGEFSSDFLLEFCCGEGILQSFTLPASPQQNGVAERRIDLVMEVAHTSVIHAVAPHFLWSFAVRYAAHQLNLWPRVSLPETSPTLRWTGKVGDASVFRVWGSRTFVCDTSVDRLSSHIIPCVFLGFPPDAPGWQFLL
ncbi:unnamed protein product, partial [Closterium sp. NIES-53]